MVCVRIVHCWMFRAFKVYFQYETHAAYKALDVSMFFLQAIIIVASLYTCIKLTLDKIKVHIFSTLTINMHLLTQQNKTLACYFQSPSPRVALSFFFFIFLPFCCDLVTHAHMFLLQFVLLCCFQLTQLQTKGMEGSREME